MNYDLINKPSDIEESLSLAGYLFKKNNDYVTSSFTTVVSPRHWLSSNKKKHAREVSSKLKNLRW